MTAGRTIIAALVVIAALAGSGCNGKSTFTDKNGNTTTFDPGKHTITITDKTGTHTVADSVDVRKLGIPLYPGANVASGSGFHVGKTTRGGDAALLTVDDSFDKVIAWYDRNLPKDAVKHGDLKTPIGGGATFTFVAPSDGMNRMVVIAGTTHKTTITVTVTGGKNKT